MYFHSFAVKFMEVPFVSSTLNIYTVGCIHNCKGCHSKDLQNINHPERRILMIDKLFNVIDQSDRFIQAICWLGGDPLYQFEDCINISKQIKEKYPHLLNVVFTGYTLSDLLKDSMKQMLLEAGYIDFIIDGEWNGHILGDKECNQKIYHFNQEMKKFDELTYDEYKNFRV